VNSNQVLVTEGLSWGGEGRKGSGRMDELLAVKREM